MCLDLIHEFLPTKFGYKVICINRHPIVMQNSYEDWSVEKYTFQISKWLDEWRFRPKKFKKLFYKIKTQYVGENYNLGFHIFVTLDAAKNYAKGFLNFRIFKVQFKQVNATGYQDGRKIIVARKIKLIEEM